MLSVFTSLATTLLNNLRLEWHVPELSYREANLCRANGFPVKAGPAAERTNDERRAALGYFVVTTSYVLPSCSLTRIVLTIK